MTEIRAETKAPGASVYRVSPRRRWLLLYVLGPIILFLIWLGATGASIERRSFWITAAILVLIGLVFQIVVDRTRLEISLEGVRLRQTGYTLAVAWTDIVDLRLTRGREGFVTREPMKGRGAGLLAALRGVAVLPGLPLYDGEQQDLLAQRRFIPIDAFGWHLHRGRMRDDLVRLAPHLAQLLPAP